MYIWKSVQKSFQQCNSIRSRCHSSKKFSVHSLEWTESLQILPLSINKIHLWVWYSQGSGYNHTFDHSDESLTILNLVRKAIKGKIGSSVFPVEWQNLALYWIYSLLLQSNLQKNNFLSFLHWDWIKNAIKIFSHCLPRFINFSFSSLSLSLFFFFLLLVLFLAGRFILLQLHLIPSLFFIWYLSPSLKALKQSKLICLRNSAVWEGRIQSRDFEQLVET